jgi:putative transposase
MTPQGALERAVQCLKGGFSHRVKKEFNWIYDIWAAGFSDHRIRDIEDCGIHVAYIARNPVKARLVENAVEYPYSSANGRFELDAFPQGLKPTNYVVASSGAAKAAPFQSNSEAARGTRGQTDRSE